MITAVHIEDEPRNIELLQTLLDKHCSDTIRLIGNAKNLPDAYTLIKTKAPQLVYLDIELNQGNGFELLEKLQNSIGINFEIIFITAFNEYAIKALRQNAVDYILKPISTIELIQATEKAVQKINSAADNKNIISLLKELHNYNTVTKIGIPVTEGLEFVNADEIIKIEAKGSYTNIHLLNNTKIVCTKTLKDIEALLPGKQFIRVHNAWVVNTARLKKYYRGKNSYMEMEDGSTVPVSIRKKSDFLDLL